MVKTRARRLAAWMALALLAPAALSTTPSGGQLPPQPAALHPPRAGYAALAPFFRALWEQERGSGQGPAIVMQLGDSHSAGDFFSARLRELLQDRFGAPGRGPLPPGIADRYYNPRLVAVEASHGWVRAQAQSPNDAGPFGLAGVRQDAAQPGETMVLRSDELEGFDAAYLTLLRRPGGGSLILRPDGAAPSRISTAANIEAPFWLAVPLPVGTRGLELETVGDGPVSLLSWGAQRQSRGVLYANFGIIGARVDVLEHIASDILAEEWRHLPPALIVIIFGTNEAFGPEALLTGYQQNFIDRVAALAARAPGSAVLIIGPPDGNRRGRAEHGRVCGRATPQHGIRGPAAWVRPATLDLVSAAQRAAATRMGWMFWDWSAAMGGPCAMHSWTQPRLGLGQPDHIHPTEAGYRLSAERLFEDLMRAYADWKARGGK